MGRRKTSWRTMGKHMTPEETAVAKEAFLAEFAKSWIIGTACTVANCSREAVYNWRRNDPDFSAAYDKAKLEADDHIRDEIFRRAVLGIEEPMVSSGRIVTTVRRYSDSLLTLLARSRMREEFSDRQEIAVTTPLLNSATVNEALDDPDTADLLTRATVRITEASETTADE